jgi:hypothetical protein
MEYHDRWGGELQIPEEARIAVLNGTKNSPGLSLHIVTTPAQVTEREVL